MVITGHIRWYLTRVTVTVVTPEEVVSAAGAVLGVLLNEHHMSRKDLAAIVSQHLDRARPYDPSTVAKWIGEGNFQVDQMVAIELALHVAPGELLRRAGYLGQSGPTLAELIPAAVELTPEDRALLAGVYERLVAARDGRRQLR